ncbi:MAG: amino acid ABC transporter permease [Ignavibacteria bacterium GWF2_33_9]|nr:MAG: amino acid ABC transporter permease [Ignavibacteria bacterium GWF2_33_9]
MRKIYVLVIFELLLTNFLFAKELRWAADAEGNAPYIFQDPENPKVLKGFEVEIADALGKELGWEPKFVQNQWDGLVPGLARNDYDVVINGLEITNDRKQEVLFSIPYYYTFEQLVVRSDDHEINSLSDLYGKRVGCLKNSLAERILIAQGGFDISSYEGEVNAFEDLKNGRLDATLVDYPIALYYASWNRELRLSGDPVGEVVYGAAMRLEDTLLLSDINRALINITRNGVLREILEKWNLWNEVMAIRLGESAAYQFNPYEFTNYMKFASNDVNFITTIERYISFMPLFLRGALITLSLSILSMILAIIVGLMLALMRVFGTKFISRIAVWIIEIIRGTPLLIQLFLIYYALPTFGIKISPFIAGIVGLGINYAAYEAENYRAGLFAVAKGQIEAALSLGMNRKQAIKSIVLPQSLKITLPPMTNDFISLLKDSSLVSVIAMVELAKVYNQIATTYFDWLGTGLIVSAIYLLLGLPFVKLAKYFEWKFGKIN